MQNDFITGALGNAQCRAVVSNVVKKVNHTDADIVYTLDTHGEDYPDTQEGRKLPVKHCIKGTPVSYTHLSSPPPKILYK